jgi:hypothetical protein
LTPGVARKPVTQQKEAGDEAVQDEGVVAKNHVWFFAIAVVLLTIKPMIAYFGKDG